MKASRNLKNLTVALLGLIVLLFTSCNKEKKGLNDAEIASVAVTANQIDVNYGKLALEKSQDPEVIKFAETMIEDHENIIQQAVDLAGELGVTPMDNAITKSLLDSENEMMNKLKALSGEDFDKAYIENEVVYHSDVIEAVKNSLIPEAQNEQLKDLLVKVTPLLDHHLEMAKAAQAKVLSGESKVVAKVYSDAQIASIAVVANQIDVDYGKIALEKSSNEANRKFAQTMINDHESIINAAVELAQKLGVTPDGDNDLTKSLLEGAEQTKEKLNSLSGAEFEKFYIQNEYDFHDAVVGAVRDVLIPQTENAELKETLQSVMPLLEHHLKMAKETLDNLQ